ncbi:MAG: hypothetical protein ASUL_07289 [Candidatus Aramenus sulfurataquae]|uniref:Phosphatidate cytidylyltransferase n=3 Tax=Candidatus Aramenus sulfurataquae TaxID=1326980 RepID=W7L5S6_9CREN|nr:MAG: hypothetical protein ASUL_07289 [Candidatus Aramenus sulfurataquae]MCL7343550.1 phosphatidate cytidylyltransferase [Candidatus Aramenus sulfurataquae]
MIVTPSDVMWGSVLVAWVAVVTLYFSKLVAKVTNIYVARKTIHMLGGGVVAIVSPFLLSSPLIPIVASYALTAFLLARRKSGKVFSWFQESQDMGEVHFTFSFGTVLLASWVLQPNFWSLDNKFLYVALLPLLYMSFGDGVTGIIRNYVYKRRFKGFWGSVGMFLVSSSLGYALLSIPGFISGVLATLVERVTKLDDNITVPLTSFAFLYLAVKFF